MCALILDSVRINAIVLPNLTKANNALKEAVTYGNKVINDAIESPISSKKNATAYGVRNFTSLLTKKLGKVSNNVNTLSIKLDQKLEKAKLIEKKNKAQTAGIAAAVGSIIGATSAAAVKTAISDTHKKQQSDLEVAKQAVIKEITQKQSFGQVLLNTGANFCKGVGSFVQGAWNSFCGLFSSAKNAFEEGCKKIANKVNSFLQNTIGPALKNIGEGFAKVGHFFEQCGATAVNLAVGFAEDTSAELFNFITDNAGDVIENSLEHL